MRAPKSTSEERASGRAWSATQTRAETQADIAQEYQLFKDAEILAKINE